MRPTQYSRAARARDDGLRRVKKITWRIGLVAAAAAAVMGAKFAHFAPSLPHLSVNDSPSSGGSPSGGSSPASNSTGTSPSSGISPSSGVSSPGGSSSGGVTTSGGS